jgi:hypothetical protein
MNDEYFRDESYAKAIQDKNIPIYYLGFQNLDFSCNRRTIKNSNSLQAVIPVETTGVLDKIREGS